MTKEKSDMDNIINSLEELKKINSAYGLSSEQIDETLARIPGAKVCTPIIGKFSSGKSALVNTLLGYSKKLLKEDITPETAVPAEIVYGDMEDSVRLFRNDGKYKDIGISDYRSMELDATTISRVRMLLRNSFLEEIPDVMIVDMPGFESGFEIHNKAIDNYLPQSLAYIAAFPADDLIVRSSVGNILKELCLNEMPICVVITKYDKRNDEYEQSLAKLKESLKRFIGDREVAFCTTSSFDGDAGQVENFLKEIQRKSGEILAGKFRSNVLSALDATEGYLRTTLKNSEMSESELDEEEEKLGKQMDTLTDKFSNERDDFNMQAAECVEKIKGDVEAALEAEEPTFVAMAMNNQNINDHINSTVRNAVTTSVNRRLVPKVEKYLKRVEKVINGDSIRDVYVSFNFDAGNISNGMTTAIVSVVAGLVLGLPIIGAIIGGIAYFIGKQNAEKKREEQKNEIRMKLRSDVYPQIMKEVGNGVEMTITKQLKLINTTIEEEITHQRSTLEKAMSDLRARMADEQEKKKNLAADIENDLKKISELRAQAEAS